ncbi:DNA repair protein complementing XP-A cells [Centruroides vittatus]|uniref:DNA repair protein complementing XP-A cells n=1 Tax=Centruroides vittatus TaxID=120091 RepID=UPI0035106D87
MEQLENSANSKKLVDNEIKLTKKQEERIERNRQKALLLRKSRLATESTLKSQSCKEQTVKVPPKLQNTGGGFLLEECDDEPSQPKTIYIEQAPPIEEDRLHCEKCDVEFVNSFLLTNFDVYICDNCRENDGCHKLITRTDAKKEYLLKDCDLDKREPPLKYIVKKNPHYSRGDMKLYLKCQVEDRAKMVWESEENLETARDQRAQDRDKRKKKAYDKKIKALRMSVRSSLYRQTNTSHNHDYGEETLKEDDVYEKTCKTCGHVLTYEKM